jgi:hypothetical protein
MLPLNLPGIGYLLPVNVFDAIARLTGTGKQSPVDAVDMVADKTPYILLIDWAMYQPDQLFLDRSELFIFINTKK